MKTGVCFILLFLLAGTAQAKEPLSNKAPTPPKAAVEDPVDAIVSSFEDGPWVSLIDDYANRESPVSGTACDPVFRQKKVEFVRALADAQAEDGVKRFARRYSHKMKNVLHVLNRDADARYALRKIFADRPSQNDANAALWQPFAALSNTELMDISAAVETGAFGDQKKIVFCENPDNPYVTWNEKGALENIAFWVGCGVHRISVTIYTKQIKARGVSAISSYANGPDLERGPYFRKQISQASYTLADVEHPNNENASMTVSYHVYPSAALTRFFLKHYAGKSQAEWNSLAPFNESDKKEIPKMLDEYLLQRASANAACAGYRH